MTPVDQTSFFDRAAGTHGNCVQAAVATLLDLPLDHVPDLIGGATTGADQDRRLRRWLRGRGLEMVRLGGHWILDAFYLASGPSARGVHHMVVMRDGLVAHDPHPSRTGLERVEQCYLVVPQDISSWTAG